MSLFDTHIMVDWSGGNDRGPTPKADAIWVCVDGTEPIYKRNRQVAEAWLAEQIEIALKAGDTLAIGFDFAFGYPKGFSRALTGSDNPFAVWEWLAERIEDTPKYNNRFDIAGEINGLFDDIGPFWGNGLKRDVDDLPRKGLARTSTRFPEKRQVEHSAKGSFPVWQLSGAGAVGSQVLMGLPVLHRLRDRFAGQVAVWPFEALTAPVAFLEVWPSLIGSDVTGHAIKDAAQVMTLARTVARLDREGHLAEVLSHGAAATEEGWILGVGCEDLLRDAATLKPPKLTNDCFALPSGVAWTPVDDALTALKSAMTCVVGSQTRSVPDAAGLILARDVIAIRSNPPAANSAVDGYAFAQDSVGSGDVLLPLIDGRAAAGAAFAGTVGPGHAIRILTGALLPEAVDTVVLEEDCSTDGTRVAFHNDLRKGSNARRAGEDVQAGATAFKAGHKLRSQDLALLTALGHGSVDVFDALRVGVLSTGDELVAPAQDTPTDRTFDANRPMLLSMLSAWNHNAVDLRHVGDDRDALRAKLDEAATRCDAILTTGGASAGDEDHVSALLRESGTLNTWRIALKPGRPLALGLWKGVPVFGLPGNPVAAFTCALVFARPALSKMAGGAWAEPQAFTVPAAFAKTKKPGRREFLRAKLNDAGAAEIFKSEGSGRISGLSWSDGFVELPDIACDISVGDPVRYLPYSGFGL